MLNARTARSESHRRATETERGEALEWLLISPSDKDIRRNARINRATVWHGAGDDQL